MQRTISAMPCSITSAPAIGMTVLKGRWAGPRRDVRVLVDAPGFGGIAIAGLDERDDAGEEEQRNTA